MSAVERRLDKIEASLTPKQAVLHWLQDAHAHGSLRAYVDSLRDAPDSAFPLIRLSDQIEAAVRSSLRRTGKREAEVWQAVRVAVRDAGFLYYLVTNLNWRVLEHKRANWLHIALVAEMLRNAVDRGSEKQLALWWGQAWEAAHTAYVQQGVAQKVAERYFDGTTPLFPDVAAHVGDQVREVERVVGIFNEALGEQSAALQQGRRAQAKESFPEPIDLERVRLDSERTVRSELALVVDLSKAEALRLIGDQDQGYALVGRHVWS